THLVVEHAAAPQQAVREHHGCRAGAVLLVVKARSVHLQIRHWRILPLVARDSPRLPDRCARRKLLPPVAHTSPRRANRAMWSAARNASAWIVIVGWPRPLVTRLLPSHTNRLRMSWVR